MNLFKLLTDLARVDPDVYGRFDSRRRVFRHLGATGRVLTQAALPGLLSGLFQKAYGQTALSGEAVTVLNLALSLEYLELYYYRMGLGAGILSAADAVAFTAIRDDEQGHVTALRAILDTAAIPDPGAAAFDYTAGGKVQPFANTANFLAVAQAFEDLGVRAYKGGLTTLFSNKAILRAALSIHSVEARHAAHIRTLRRGGVGVAGADGGGTNDSLPKSWVSLRDNNGPLPVLTTAIYGPGTTAASPAEDNLVQARVNVQVNSSSPSPSLALTAAAASEAFDEPLDTQQVRAIAVQFVAAGNSQGLFIK
ncbi:MAG: ferritin-like domain-containing protein [Janthinobacterium lividum]